MEFSLLDITLFVAYILLILLVAFRAARRKNDATERTAEDYFLASKSLPWWVIGTSLIASNISAEQLIGMSGSGYVLGLAIATYEWIAAVMLILIAVFFLPVYLQKNIQTIPGYLKVRFGSKVSLGLSVFWVALYIFVNLSSVLYLGGLAVSSFVSISLETAIWSLALFCVLYSLYGGFASVAWTDVLQVVFLVIGGIVVTYISVRAVSGDHGFFSGLEEMMNRFPEHFNVILSADHPYFHQLPGVRVLFGGLWVLGMAYWGCSQYITQRAFAGKNLREAQYGMLLAAFLKLFLPIIVVLPGIAVLALNITIDRPDEAYPVLLSTFMPTGFKGITFAALIAAIASSVSSMANSTATIFTLDILPYFLTRQLSERAKVITGRTSGLAALIIAAIVAKYLQDIEQVFQFIQEYTGFVSPAILVLFLFGIFWPGMNRYGAFATVLSSVPLSVLFKYLFPELPFLDRIGIVFIILCIMAIVVSRRYSSTEDKNYELPDFKTDKRFKVFSGIILLILIAIYAYFW